MSAELKTSNEWNAFTYPCYFARNGDRLSILKSGCARIELSRNAAPMSARFGRGRNYLLYCRRFAAFFMRSPEELGAAEVRTFLLHQIASTIDHSLLTRKRHVGQRGRELGPQPDRIWTTRRARSGAERVSAARKAL